MFFFGGVMVFISTNFQSYSRVCIPEMFRPNEIYGKPGKDKNEDVSDELTQALIEFQKAHVTGIGQYLADLIEDATETTRSDDAPAQSPTV